MVYEAERFYCWHLGLLQLLRNHLISIILADHNYVPQLLAFTIICSYNKESVFASARYIKAYTCKQKEADNMNGALLLHKLALKFRELLLNR